ncbi:hypothetical protein BLOT_003815 [Blomia tropicalis]|nr:hypothetical protein BLOT_003815 [Blomia tropicalis]
MDEITSSSSNEVAVEWMLSCTGGATNALVLSQCLASSMFVFGMASSSIGLVRFQLLGRFRKSINRSINLVHINSPILPFRCMVVVVTDYILLSYYNHICTKRDYNSTRFIVVATYDNSMHSTQ